jgi:hypothetical protein
MRALPYINVDDTTNAQEHIDNRKQQTKTREKVKIKPGTK